MHNSDRSGQEKTMSDKSIELDIELEKEKELDIEHYKEENKQENYDYSSVIKYLNEKANKKFRTVESNTKYIRSRYKEGYKLEDFKKVIDTKVDEWKDTAWIDNRNGKTVSGNDMLRPSTLFGSKFDGYLNQTNQKKKITKSKVILEYS